MDRQLYVPVPGASCKDPASLIIYIPVALTLLVIFASVFLRSVKMEPPANASPEMLARRAGELLPPSLLYHAGQAWDITKPKASSYTWTQPP
jgi:hypothetical protein